MTNARPTATKDRPAGVASDQLWIDGCGGFLLARGNFWTLGGVRAANTHSADIRIQADLPRTAGQILRSDSDYFWQPSPILGQGDKAPAKLWLDADHAIPVPGSAKVHLSVPSPLSGSAVLTLQSTHRFADHIDAVVLVADTVLIGPGKHCHIRCDELFQRYVLSHRDERWHLVRSGQDDLTLAAGERVQIDDVSMTLVKS